MECQNYIGQDKKGIPVYVWDVVERDDGVKGIAYPAYVQWDDGTEQQWITVGTRNVRVNP